MIVGALVVALMAFFLLATDQLRSAVLLHDIAFVMRQHEGTCRALL